MKLISFLLFLLTVNFNVQASSARWYSVDQLEQGGVLFKNNCAVCHGQNAEATPNWKQTDANGNYPPPPLNGTAHAWHHDLSLLRKTVREGGQKMGGLMPPFEQKLSTDEIDSVIAYFQSKWPDELYQKWATRFEIKGLAVANVAMPAEAQKVTRFLRKQLGNIDLGSPQKTAVTGLWRVKVNESFVYLLEDGKYAIIGELIDLENGRNLSKNPLNKE